MSLNCLLYYILLQWHATAFSHAKLKVQIACDMICYLIDELMCS